MQINLLKMKLKLLFQTDMTTRNAEGNNPAIVEPVVLTFKITDTKLCYFIKRK